LAALGYRVCLLADDDLQKKDREQFERGLAKAKEEGVEVFSWQVGHSTESQLLAGLPEEALRHFVALAIQLNDSEDPRDSVLAAIGSRLGSSAPTDADPTTWPDWTNDPARVRRAISEAAKKNKWFKSESKGERLGELLATHAGALDPEGHLATTLDALRHFALDPDGDPAST
jgi:hypothetical protein